MKKYLCFMAACIAVVGLSSCARASYWNEGNYGYDDDHAYIIDSVNDFLELRDRVNNGTEAANMYYKLNISSKTLTINYTGTGISSSSGSDWVPIGTESNPFMGHFNGNGQTIKATISRFKKGVAVFGTVKTTSGYAVKNLNVSGTVGYDQSINSMNKTQFAAGIVLNLYSGSIEDCTFTGTIYAKGNHYSSQYTYGEDVIHAYAGGIVEHMYSGSIKNCTVKNASITTNPYWSGAQGYAGGIVARMESGTIEGCTVENVTLSSNSQAASESSEGSDGNKRADVSSGGIASVVNAGTIKNNISYAVCAGDTAYGKKYLGGVIGKLGGTTLSAENNIYAGAAYGIGYDAGGGEGDEPGCINAAKVKLSISKASLAGGTVNTQYSDTLTAEVEPAALSVTWSLTSGTLPEGLTIDESTGVISGLPTTAGSSTFTVKAAISNGLREASKQYTLTVSAAQPVAQLTITNESLPAGTTGTSYSAALTAKAFGMDVSPVTWSVSSGNLPAGLSLNASTGEISGTPTTAGSYTFTLSGKWGELSGTKDFTITIAAAQTPAYTLSITKTSLTAGKVGTSYSDTLTAALSSGANVSPAWSVSSGSLPAGLSLNASTGTITGTPTTAGNYTFTVNASYNALSASKQFTITIASASSGGGTGTGMPIAFDDPPEFFDAHQPVLEGAIVARFFVNLNGNSGEDSYVDFKVLNDTKYNQPQMFDQNFMNPPKTGYGFKCILTSIQMADPITATFHYGNNQTVSQTWTLKEYLDKYYNSDASPAKLKNLLAAMKDYGHYAQIALEANNDWTLGVDHIAMDCANEYTDADLEEARQAVSSYAIVRDTGSSGIQTVPFTLRLDSDTVLDVLIYPASSYSGSVAAYAPYPKAIIGVEDTTANLAVGQVDTNGNKYYLVRISGIPAHQLAFTNTIRVVTDRSSFEVKVSALSYANTVFTSSNPALSNTDMKKAVTSLYRYYKATKEYRGE